MRNPLREIQSSLLEMLNEVISICDKHNILYFADSGTLLGAIRHKGFIPWDDDIDIIFWRKDYEKFLSVAKFELPCCLKLILPENNEHYIDYITKIINPNIDIRANTGEARHYGSYVNKLAVDLLVLDKANPCVLMQKNKVVLIKIIYGLAMSRRFVIDYSKYNFLEKFQVGLLSNLGRLFSYKTTYDWYQKAIQMDNHTNSEFCFGGLSTPPYLGRIIPARCYERAITMKFEGMDINVPVGYDEILSITYGNYQKLPKEEDRVPVHASVDLLRVVDDV